MGILLVRRSSARQGEPRKDRKALLPEGRDIMRQAVLTIAAYDRYVEQLLVA